tara:strand:- start:1416 stop:1736 length:321 start_codon:yes stop_codon:yes gene_type:complete
LKYLIAFTFLSFLVYVNSYSSNDYKGTEVTITVPKLNNIKIKTQLENEFKKEKSIEYIDGSLLTNTIVIKVDDQTFSKKKIDQMLEKWGCEGIDYYYRKLSSFNIN